MTRRTHNPMLYLGYHISSANGFAAMGREAIEAGANTFAFFTRNPRGGKAKDIDPEDVAELLKLTGKFGKLVAHAPYTLNPCSDKDHVRDFARFCMEDDMKRMEYLPGNYYNFHPGSHVGQGSEKGIQLIADLLNSILTPEQTTTVLLETMSGKGSEIGGTFEELAAIIDKVELKDKIGVCMDTCHVSDAGYDIISNLDQVIEEFDQVVGLKYLKALHINDSKNPPGARKDRHERLGQGTIGLKAIRDFVNHPALRGLPCILETPNEFEGYKEEIQLLRAGRPCTYILECAGGRLYTGWTNDIEKRLASHTSGKGAKFTHAFQPEKLVYLEHFDTKQEAMRREAAIKKLTKKEKLKLIQLFSSNIIK